MSFSGLFDKERREQRRLRREEKKQAKDREIEERRMVKARHIEARKRKSGRKGNDVGKAGGRKEDTGELVELGVGDDGPIYCPECDGEVSWTTRTCPHCRAEFA